MFLTTLQNKSLGKLSILPLLLLFIVSAFAVTSSPSAFAASSDFKLGIVDYQKVVPANSGYQNYVDQMEIAQADAKKDFDTNAAKMTDKEKQAYSDQLKQRLQTKQQQLIKDLLDRVAIIVKSIADSKGLTTVVDKATVYYGGTDITDDVIKAEQGK